MKQRKAWQGVLAAAGISVVSIAGGCQTGISDDDIQVTSVVGVRARQSSLKDNAQAVVLLDSRNPAAYRERHIACAINFTLAQAPTSRAGQDPRLRGYEAIVVYGANRGDNGAKGLTKRLMELEYKGVYWFSGGLEEWALAGGKTEGVGSAP